MSYIIAIDGPSASGKSTVAKKLANKLNFIYIDTGAMYRALTYEVLNRAISFSDEKEIVKVLNDIKLNFTKDNKIFLNNQDVTQEIRSREVSNGVSAVSSHIEVRKILVKYQQSLVEDNTQAVIDGRDIGTVVFPNANLKIFQTASCEARAKRRFLENSKRNINTPLEILTEEIKDRDFKDSNKTYGALRQATDAYLLDTSELTIDEAVDIIIKMAVSKGLVVSEELK